MSSFKALVVTKPESGYACDFASFDEQDLMDGDITVRVTHSTVNYKDGLADHRQGSRRAPVPDDPGRRFRRRGDLFRPIPNGGPATMSSSTAGASARRISAAMPSAPE